jgi:hypothetical protein
MKTDHDLMGLMKFIGRDEWKRHFEEVLGEHFGLAAQEFASVSRKDWPARSRHRPKPQ